MESQQDYITLQPMFQANQRKQKLMLKLHCNSRYFDIESTINKTNITNKNICVTIVVFDVKKDNAMYTLNSGNII